MFTVNGAGTPTSWFFNVVAGDKVVGRQPFTGNRRFYHSDLLGSTRAVTDGVTGAVLESYDFEPWGLLMPGRTLGSGTKEGFTGKEQDLETGLDYFGARYYMPALARWTGVDPLAEKHPEWTPYNYVLNNPARLIDPDGRQVTWGDAIGLNAHLLPQVRAIQCADGCGSSRWTASKAEAVLLDVGQRLAPAEPAIEVAGTVLNEATSLAMPAVLAVKRVNLPSKLRVRIDMEHIRERHMVGGSKVTPESTLFPENMSERGVERAVREAYGTSSPVSASRGDRVKLRGTTKSGLNVQMILNKAEKLIETAYTILKGVK